MTAQGACFKCGQQTGTYDSVNKRWDCGCGKRQVVHSIAPKYVKLLKTGRWSLVSKTVDGRLVPVGVTRKSTGEIRWF